MRAGVPKHPAPVVRFHEDEQARGEIVIAERHRRSVDGPPPESYERTWRSRGVSCGPDMPCRPVDLGDV